MRRVLFTGKSWMSETPVAAWRPTTKQENVNRQGMGVGMMYGLLAEIGNVPAGVNAKCFHALAVIPMDGSASLELQSLQILSDLRSNGAAARFSLAAPDAVGVATGRVLAVSEHYAAQQVGKDRVVFHEQKNLSRPLTEDEDASLSYEDGKAMVFAGIAHDVHIDAPWMLGNEKAYMRTVLFNALASMKAPESDVKKLRDATRYSFEAMADFFGLKEPTLRHADIHVVVNKKATTLVSNAAPAAVPVSAPRRGMRA